MSLHYTANNVGKHTETDKILFILLHGGALSSSMYQTLTPLLAFPSIAVDLPGHGKSHQHGPFSFDRSTELLECLIQHLKRDGGYDDYKMVLVGVSLGGQAVLHFVTQHPKMVYTAVVSGATIHPPDERASWKMPHMPTEKLWLDLMGKDIEAVGMEAAKAIQVESFGFTLDEEQIQENVSQGFPPLLICIGEHDVAMAKRDWPELLRKAQSMNTRSSGMVINDAWHNHPIDVSEAFAKLIND